MSAGRITRPQGPGSGGMWGAYPAPDVKAFPGARRTAGGHRPKKAAAAPSRYDRNRGARKAVRMTTATATNTAAVIEAGARSFEAPSAGSRMYMYQMTRAWYSRARARVRA